jgi:hypothetical protein
MKPLDNLFDKSAGLMDPEGPAGFSATGLAAGLGGFFGGPPGAAIASGLTQRIATPKSDERIQQEAASEVFTPEHESEMQKIRIQSMLSEFMSADPIISTYDPDEVATAYNQIIHMAPRASVQPVIMRGLLRRFLQQQDALEPHEAGQLAELEERLKKLEVPTALPVSPLIEMGAK